MIFFLGVLVILLVLRDVFHSAVPRGMSTGFCLAPILVRNVFWPPFLFLASVIPTARGKAEVLGLFAPCAILLLLIIWICLIALGFAFMTLALGTDYSPHVNSLANAFYISATAVFTIGSTSEFAQKADSARLLMLSGALIGLILTASIVSLMFGLIAAIQPREVVVSVISNLGGSKPSGINILETYAQTNGRDQLPAFFDECHHWCADVLETHRAFPILPYFRSNDPYASWVTALGALLDAISLLAAADPDSCCCSAQLSYQIGCKLIKEFVSIFKLVLAEPAEISDEEFHALFVRLESAGYMTCAEEQARTNFHLLRRGYASGHRAIAEYLAAPLTPMSSSNERLFPDLKSSGLLQAN